MLHSVGCAQPSASVFIKNWNSASYDRACVHGFIDGNDGTVYQTLPWDHRGWHAGTDTSLISTMGTDVGGSATPIGASANVVGTSVSAKSGHPISWARYCKISGPATIMVILLSTIYIWIVYL